MLPTPTAPQQPVRPNFPKGTLYVTIQECNPQTAEIEHVGFIGWDGSKYVFDFPEDNSMAGMIAKDILGERIMLPETFEVVDKNSPEKYLGGLQYQFRSAYFNVGAPLKA